MIHPPHTLESTKSTLCKFTFKKIKCIGYNLAYRRPYFYLVLPSRKLKRLERVKGELIEVFPLFPIR